MRQIANLSHADAMKIIGAIQKELEKQNKGAAVAVADAHGELIAFLRTDGCRLPSINIAIKKALRVERPAGSAIRPGIIGQGDLQTKTEASLPLI
jgi:uncharacterized protein GlcG (DUF336 family)